MNPVSLSGILFVLAEFMLALYLLRRRIRRRQVAREYKSTVREMLTEKSRKPKPAGSGQPLPASSAVSIGLDA